MSEPLIVVIPHSLGKDEALRRIKAGIGRARGEFARLLTIEEEAWSGDTADVPRRGAGTARVRNHRRL